MSDTLYLSLWYPNLRLEALAEKLTAVLGAFAAHGGAEKVYSAAVWPVGWNETPVFERVYGRMGSGAERGVDPRQAVEDAMELLHDDYAYEFQIGWSLWELEAGPPASQGAHDGRPKATADPSTSSAAADFAQDDRSKELSGLAQDDRDSFDASIGGGALVQLDARWARAPRLVRVTGYGPLFDEGAYEQDGHIRIDFGPDAPFLEEGADLDQVGARRVEENVRQLVELAAAVEKASGATARLLWSELGESLAQRLAARLGMGN